MSFIRKYAAVVSVLLLSTSLTAFAKKTPDGPPLIKADSLALATLDNEINTSHPANTIIATITDGKYKGAHLEGTLTQTMSGTKQLDRTILYFNVLRLTNGSRVNIAAMAIDAQTASDSLDDEAASHALHRKSSRLAAEFLRQFSNTEEQTEKTERLKRVIVDAGTTVGVIYMSNVYAEKQTHHTGTPQ